MRADEELNTLLGGSIAQGGVVPHIHSFLLDPKTEHRKAVVKAKLAGTPIPPAPKTHQKKRAGAPKKAKVAKAKKPKAAAAAAVAAAPATPPKKAKAAKSPKKKKTA